MQNDIIELKDRNDSLFPDIADKAPKLSYFDDEALNNQIQSAADSILDMAKNHVRGTEFAYIISTDSPYAFSEPIIGGEGMMAVKIPRCDYSAITLHNHPSGGTFSARDIDRFVVDENAKAMCLIGNSGNWYILEKTDSFNWYKFQMDVFDFAYSDDFADIILKGADKYGFKYYEKIYR